MTSTRRARAKVALTATGDLYLLHFHQRLGTGKHSIQHYLGFTPDLETRLDKHRRGQGRPDHPSPQRAGHRMGRGGGVAGQPSGRERAEVAQRHPDLPGMHPQPTDTADRGEPTGSLGTPEAETARRLARRPTPPGPVACADHVGPPELGCPRGRCLGAICQPAAASAAEPILLWCDTGE